HNIAHPRARETSSAVVRARAAGAKRRSAATGAKACPGHRFAHPAANLRERPTRQSCAVRRNLPDHFPGESSDMTGYKLATYQSADGPRAGLVIDDQLFDAAKLTANNAYSTVIAIMEDWRSAQGALSKAAAKAGKGRVKGLPLGRTKLLAPVRWPSGS